MSRYTTLPPFQLPWLCRHQWPHCVPRPSYVSGCLDSPYSCYCAASAVHHAFKSPWITIHFSACVSINTTPVSPWTFGLHNKFRISRLTELLTTRHLRTQKQAPHVIKVERECENHYEFLRKLTIMIRSNTHTQKQPSRDTRFPPQLNWILPYSGLLRGVR